MLSLSFIRENSDIVRQAIADRRDSADIEGILRLDSQRRDISVKADDLKRERNEASRRIGRKDVAEQDIDALKEHMGAIGDQIREYDRQLSGIDEELNGLLLRVPNIPHASVPVGTSEDDNVVIKTWGEKPTFDFEPRAHDDIGRQLGIFHTEAAVSMSGTRFYTLSGAGARLSRALAQYMLDLHVGRHGFEEHWVPYLVKRDAMVVSGQLPKFEEEAYYIEKEDMFLIPTGEVPLVNMFAGQTVDGSKLPIKVTTASPSFRREAGAAGKDTRGMIRVHQFEKVELVMIADPDASVQAHEDLLGYAEAVLQNLQLAYQVMLVNTSDMGFGQVKQYDPEVWMPGQAVFREISSCSNMGDFQARRGGIKYSTPGQKPRFVHTLNASGLAVGRTMAALLENYQSEDGSVALPSVLAPYMGGQTELRPAS